MERCLMCKTEMRGRKGKAVCSTTCRVNKKKAWDEYDKLFNHFVKLNVGRDRHLTDRAWKRSIVEAIIDNEKKLGAGNVAIAWRKKKHPKFVQIEIEDLK